MGAQRKVSKTRNYKAERGDRRKFRFPTPRQFFHLLIFQMAVNKLYANTHHQHKIANLERHHLHTFLYVNLIFIIISFFALYCTIISHNAGRDEIFYASSGV
jgi:hypothetical protein